MRTKTDKPEEVDLYDHRLYINRELSWLEFNRRCLAEAEDHANPLLERAKFLAIAYGNMDEFFMIRVPGIIGNNGNGTLSVLGPDSYEDSDLLMKDLNEKVDSLVDGYETCWSDIKKGLAERNIRIRSMDMLSKQQRMWVEDYYAERVHPLLTPLALDTSHPFPFISNNSLNVAVRLARKDGENLYARVKVPSSTTLPRFVKIPSDSAGRDFIQLEDIVRSNIGQLFPGLDVLGAYMFRVTRNADVKVTIDEACDLMSAVETSLDSRDTGFPVRMVVEDTMPEQMVALFGKNLKLEGYQIHRALGGCMMMNDLWEIASINAPALKEKSFAPYVPPELEEGSIFNAIKQKDWILMHPYETFDTVVRFVDEAADDRDVQSIKICLYRIGNDPSIIKALMRAKEKGKTVSVLMELRAKFDETNNIHLARELEKMGVHVVYGPVDLKVHSKLLQVVRLEGEHLVRYTHMSSGNYNISTAKQYADISYLTANQEMGEDVGELFNALTGFFGPRNYKHLLVAPISLKNGLIERIRREADHQRAGRKGYIAMKANGLIDSDIIVELYKASMAGVYIDLSIRGLCCLRPGIKGISDNICVTSVVDRFLEHSRIYYFENDGDPEMYMGSSDMMPRNMIARVEVLFPVLDKNMLVLIRDRVLRINLIDNVKARELKADGSYVPVARKPREKKVRSQKWFIDNRGVWHG
jgi:polyphosphate kinase